MATLDLDAVADVIAQHVEELQQGHAGGSVQMWGLLPDGTGRVVCVTDPDGPFADHDEIDVDAFTVGVYPSQDDFLDGGDFTTITDIAPTLPTLAKHLTTLAGQIRCECECDRVHFGQGECYGEGVTDVEGYPVCVPCAGILARL